MKEISDNFFNLAIVDPPYGIGLVKTKNGNWGIRGRNNNCENDTLNYDNDIPSQLYFNELFRISKNQIIFGANNFLSRINIDSTGWIVWNKMNGNNYFSDCELAFTSFNKGIRIFSESTVSKNRIHANQKPVNLYIWILKKYAKLGDKIFDSHMGSQSSRIAAYKMGFDYWGCELNKEYFNSGCERFAKECKGEIRLINGKIIKQMELFYDL